MPLYLRGRRRRKTLREEVLAAQTENLRLEEDDDNKSVVSLRSDCSSDSALDVLSTTPSTLRGSFLRNKLENPLFKSLFHKKGQLKPLQNSSDDDIECETDFEIEDNAIGKAVETDAESRWWPFSRSRNRKTGAEVAPRLRRNFFKPRKSPLKKEQKRLDCRISSGSDSNQSETSNSNSSSFESDVETLTRVEDSADSPECDLSSPSFVLYSQKGKPVRVNFCQDYLQISPLRTKRRQSRGKKSDLRRIVYYEDLALWTNNENCLRLVHIRNKDTVLQERAEIKLFVNKKKIDVTPQELNEILKAKVAKLISQKLGVTDGEAQRIMDKTVSRREVSKVVQRIDMSSEKYLAQSYQNRDLSARETYALTNV